MVPTETDADVYVPAGASKSVPVRAITTDYGVAFDDPASISNPTNSGLFSTAILTFLSEDEQIPAYGTSSFLTLSLTDLLPLTSFVAGYIGPFDIGAWGGLHVLVLPTAATGQGICQVEVKQSAPGVGTGWFIYGSWAFWPGLPLEITIPRTARYVRILLNGSGITGNPAIGGSVAVRASLSEISQLSATPSVTPLQQNINVAALGSATAYFTTVGLKAVTARLNVAVGTGAELVVYTSNSPTGPWALVTFREQSVAGFYNSIARTIGQLDAYLRLDILDIAGGGLQTTLSVSIQESPDLTGYMQNIYSALGDTGQPVNVGQSIYHVLKNSDAKLATLDTRVDGLETLITSTNTKLDTLIFQTAIPSTNVTAIFPTSAGGAYVSTGVVLTNGCFIISAMVGYQLKQAMPDDFAIQLALGTAAVPVVAFYGGIGLQPEGALPIMMYGGPRAGGFNVVTPNTTLWIYTSAGPCFLTLNLGIRTS
jgi:hypothetical protein